MKKRDFQLELKKMTPEQCVQKLLEYRRALFMLRLSKKTSHAKDSSQFKKLRRAIARVLTFIQSPDKLHQSDMPQNMQ